MAGATYNDCKYEGGFQGMKPSGEATLALSAEQFVLRRPRVFFSRSLYKLWAKWSAVTELAVSAADGGSRLELATKARGMGAILLPEVTPDELWAVLDEIADLKDRFHTAGAVAASGAEEGETMTEAGDGAGGLAGEDVTDDAGEGEAEPTGAAPQGAAARSSLLGEDVSGDAGPEVEQADGGAIP